jgi:hypothetical protein
MKTGPGWNKTAPNRYQWFGEQPWETEADIEGNSRHQTIEIGLSSSDCGSLGIYIPDTYMAEIMRSMGWTCIPPQ